MAPEALSRYRITFAKTEAMRFTSHLDLHRTWERTLRRAGLPLAYSRGFRPHPRINIGAALPLGCLSTADLMDIWLEQPVPAADVRAAVDGALPPGLGVESVVAVDADAPVLQKEIVAAEYETAAPAVTAPDLRERIRGVLEASALPRQRRGKAYDLRPLIEDLAVDAAGRLRMRLSAREGATGRPEEVLDALGLEPPAVVPIRTRLSLAAELSPAPPAG